MTTPSEILVPEPMKTSILKVDVKSVHQQVKSAHESNPEDLTIVQYHPDMAKLYHETPRHVLLVSMAHGTKNPFFHGCCVYAHEKEELYITSGLLQTTIASRLPIIIISQLKLKRKNDLPWETLESFSWSKLRPPPNMPMPAGACRYNDGIVYCAQGIPKPGTGGIYYMPAGRPPELLVSSYFGREFNSVQDVTASPDGVLWFVDSDRGFQNDIKPPPQLPNTVYRYNPELGDLRAMTHDINNPLGIAISHNDNTLYVSDYGARKSDGKLEITSETGIFAFDIVQKSGSQFLCNKRLFASPLKGAAYRLYVDGQRNVLATCEDGVEVWGPDGTLLGVLQVPGGASALWINDQEMFICSDQRLWWMDFSD